MFFLTLALSAVAVSPAYAWTTTTTTASQMTSITSSASNGPPPTCVTTSTTATVTVNAPTATPTKAVGRLPALGWNTWNAFHCNITADLVVGAANDLKRLGLADAGYQYVNIDDCWAQLNRDNSTLRIVPDPQKFPDGISGVADQVHTLGLKLGIYGDAGTSTCAGYPGSLGYEDIDAATFTEWGVDFAHIFSPDNCYVPVNWTDSCTPPGGDWCNSNSAIRYRRMTAALDVQKSPVQYSLCIWGQAHVWEWGSKVGHSWRVTDWSSVVSIITANAAILDYVDFYSHNDMDMMEIGNGNLTIQEQRTHFSVWAFMKSPILLGATLSNLSADQLSIISNPALLAFHQDDENGAPAKPFQATSTTHTTTPPEYYAGKSKKGIHIFIINTLDSTTTKTFDYANVPYIGEPPYTVTDMWTGAIVVQSAGSAPFSVSVDAHDTKAYLITSVDV
ncbi:glycoside hydrolase family 27 protein [Scleroderma citrinum Foug A]|uniref:Alpha-galactosidase n=1 Tax=Scleroderma citrinum Foug A TaxID=1036808 RepID=A0A0C3EPK5_9AGAM|nr:glycoside hydrolase family 27 protein [Scleroderma citrinum Foug A]